MESNEQVDFHSSESNGNMNSLIVPLGAPRRKGGKQALERPVVDKSPEKQEEEAPRVEKFSKEFLAFMDTFCVFLVQQGEVTT